MTTSPAANTDANRVLSHDRLGGEGELYASPHHHGDINLLMLVAMVELMGGRPLCLGYIRSGGSRGDYCVDRVAREHCHIPYCILVETNPNHPSGVVDVIRSSSEANSCFSMPVCSKTAYDADVTQNNEGNDGEAMSGHYVVLSEKFANCNLHKIQKLYWDRRGHPMTLVVSCSAIAKVVYGVEYKQGWTLASGRLFPDSSDEEEDGDGTNISTTASQEQVEYHVHLPISQYSDFHFHSSVMPCLQCATSISVEVIDAQSDDIYSLPAFFLHGFTKLRRLTSFQRLEHVVTVPMGYLHHVSTLQHLTLENFPNVTEVEDLFLSGCSSIVLLDLSPLRHVTSIGMAFLQGCSSLTTLDLSPLTSVFEIGSFFLAGCSRLKSIDLQPLMSSFAPPSGSITEFPSSSFHALLPNDFLRECASLTTIDLTPLAAIEIIGDGFMSGCVGLMEINLSPLECLNEVRSRFLEECTSLKVVDLKPLLERGVMIHPVGLVEGCSADVLR